ncbi:MAG TPA: hypothetical protein VJ992_02110 [Gemmatimonadales bacterium]|nr:hypothetical protein [Gemmatimonadales bacterium]
MPPELTGAGFDGERRVLPRELSDFLIQFSIALHRYAMYPEGHPSLAPTTEHALERLTHLLRSRDTLSLGVARNQLVIEGVATDPKNAVLHELAGRLHRHHLGAVTFLRGVTISELHTVLELIAAEADRTGQPIGLDIARHAGSWPHVRLYPLTYDRLQLVDQDGAPPPDDEAESRTARTRAAQLWIGLARAALAADHDSDTIGLGGSGAQSNDDDGDERLSDPTEIARAIDQHRRDAAYDQVIVGYMLQIADELKGGGTAESAALKRRVSQLVSTLESGTLGRLLEMGGDRAQQRRFLLSATEGMAVDAVLELVRAASTVQDETISDSMLRMLRKLATHADTAHGQRRVLADASIREQVAEMIRGWSLRDPNPDEYRRALKAMAVANPIFAVAPERQYLPEPRRVIQMAIEMDAVGEPVFRAADQLIDAGELPWLVETLNEAAAVPTTEAIWAHVATPARLTEILGATPLDVDLLGLVADRLGLAATDPLIDALTGSESSQTRRVILQRLAALGPAVGPNLVRRLDDPRWFVVRNMLALLAELPALPDGFSAAPHAEHADARVRREALRILLRDAETRERGICMGLADSDERAVRLALTAAQQGCPASAIPLVVACATQGTTSDQRVTALRLLGSVEHHLALDTLLAMTAPRKTFFGERPPAKTREYLTALLGLHTWSEDPRARQALAYAARSRDPEVVAAAVGGRALGENA